MYAIKICGYTKVTGNPKSINIKKCYWQIYLYKATLKFTNGSKVAYNVNKGAK